MTNGTGTAIVLVMLIQGLTGCSDSRTPTAPPRGPSPPTTPPAPTLKVFTDSAGFSTSDLRDVQDQIVQFNTANQLIWTAGDTRLQGYRVETHPFPNGAVHFISGAICGEGCDFEVRFGSKDGERRAYLTVDYGHDNPGTIVDVEVVNGALVVTQSKVFPPGTPTLSGIVAELTPAGLVPVSGVNVYRSVTTGWRGATTDKDGLYAIPGLIDGIDAISVSKEGYQTHSQNLTMTGDTRLDIQLVRR
jgi:Carboxypeptidase regulatory-like domain